MISLFKKWFPKKQVEYKEFYDLPVKKEKSHNDNLPKESPSKEFANEINNPAKRGLLELQQELNGLKQKIRVLEERITKTKNSQVLKEYNQELKELKRKKILCETSMDARKRAIR